MPRSLDELIYATEEREFTVTLKFSPLISKVLGEMSKSRPIEEVVVLLTARGLSDFFSDSNNWRTPEITDATRTEPWKSPKPN